MKAEPSEEESPTAVQQRNVREAEMLTSNLGEGGISQQEILSDVGVLKELAILQESMEWFAGRITDFADDLRKPIVNGLMASGGMNASPIVVKDGMIKVLVNLALEFEELANTCLLVLHLEVRVQCFHYLKSSPSDKFKANNPNKNDSLEPDAKVLKLTKVLSDMDEALSSTLHPRKTKVSFGKTYEIFHLTFNTSGKLWELSNEIFQGLVLKRPTSITRTLFFQYVFEGLAHLASRILIMAANSMEFIDHAGVQRMCRNALALQQTLSSITASREVALDYARSFYEMFYLEPDVSSAGIYFTLYTNNPTLSLRQEILTSIIEKGSQFTEMQYLNALHLICKNRGVTDQNTLAMYQQKLSDVLGTKPGMGVTV